MSGSADGIRIVDVVDAATFALLPPCADPSFDHRTCDHWEDAARGSRASRPGWLAPASPAPDPGAAVRPAAGVPRNPFAPEEPPDAGFNPFLVRDEEPLHANPFAPAPPARSAAPADGPRKLQLLTRGLGVAGSYAKVLLLDGVPAAYAQFGPLSAYPRASRLRELYPQLPDAPLPAVITCVATTADARGRGLGRRLVSEVCDDLAGRGFAAVEAFPEADAGADATSAASPAFWIEAGFSLAVADDRYPVLRREL
ncbi:MAG: hypothetical protein RL338_424 [Chloroflexota bacterium]